MSEALTKLQADWKFIIQDDQADKRIRHFIFEDGRHYKFQTPGFFTTYTEVWDTQAPALSLLKLGMRCTFSENENTPKLDEHYLDEHRDEAWGLWSPLFRGLL